MSTFAGEFTTYTHVSAAYCIQPYNAGQRRAEVRWSQANLSTWQAAASHQPHIGPITGMQYLPGREDLMFSCGTDGRVRLWNSCMQELCLLEPFSVGINCMDLCPAKPSVLAVCPVLVQAECTSGLHQTTHSRRKLGVHVSAPCFKNELVVCAGWF